VRERSRQQVVSRLAPPVWEQQLESKLVRNSLRQAARVPCHPDWWLALEQVRFARTGRRSLAALRLECLLAGFRRCLSRFYDNLRPG
jgi:hypothetical protein